MLFTIRRRYLQISAVLSLSFLLIFLSLSKHAPSAVKSLNFIDSLSLSLFNNEGAEKTDADSVFNKKVTQVLEAKEESDLENRYWSVDTELTSDQTQLTIPNYYTKSISSRPIIAPFDPRFTLAMYHSYIARHPDTLKDKEVPFHWSDWVDMTVLNKYLFSANKSNFSCSEFDLREYQEHKWPESKSPFQRGAFDPASFCRKTDEKEGEGLGFVIDSYFGRTTPEMSMILGKANLYTSAPNPFSITFLTKDGSYTVQVAREKSKLLKNSMVGEYMAENGMSTKIDTLQGFKLLQEKLPAVKDEVFHDYEVHLRHADFIYEPSKVMKYLEQAHNSQAPKAQEVNYIESVKYSMAHLESPPKYFEEARIFDTVKGDHYDWRFFNGFKLGSQEQSNTLHRLVRSWLSFTRKQGLVTWMAHGSLLSWYWNGVAFPWDNDIDVQMPVMSLHKMSMNFNQSLIVEDAEDGFGRYFLDCGSFIATRNHANGLNNIDARFIDVDSGLYIDITGLAVTQDPSPDRYHNSLPSNYVVKERSAYETNDLIKVYNCRDRHFSSFTELSPLVKTFVEGEVAYVPKRYSDILTYEYEGKGMLQNLFADHLYIPQIRLWVHQDTLRFFIRHRPQWIEYYTTPQDSHKALSIPKTTGKLNHDEIKTLLGLKEKDLLDLLLGDDLLIEYISTRDLTAMHESEIMKLVFGKSTQDLVDAAPDFKPLMYEPFLYHLNSDFTNFETRVALFERLQEKMEYEIAQQEATSKETKVSKTVKSSEDEDKTEVIKAKNTSEIKDNAHKDPADMKTETGGLDDSKEPPKSGEAPIKDNKANEESNSRDDVASKDDAEGKKDHSQTDRNLEEGASSKD